MSHLTISDAAAALRSGETTSCELVERAISVADATDLEGGFEPSTFSERSASVSVRDRARFVIWRGPDDCRASNNVNEIRPDDVVVFASGSETVTE